MTREEAIKVIHKMLACTDLTDRANLNADMVDACHLAIKALEQETVTEFADRCQECGKTIKQKYTDEVLEKIRAEIAEYGSIWVEYKITGNSNRDIEKLVSDVLSQAKEQVLDVIDKYKAETEADNG